MGRDVSFGGQTLGSLGLAVGRDHGSGEDPVYSRFRLQVPFNPGCLSDDLTVLLWALWHTKG